MARIVKALLCIPLRNADADRDLSENRQHRNERVQLWIQNVNGNRHIISFSKHLEGDASGFNVTPEVSRAVPTLRKERIATEKAQAALRLVLVETGSSKKCW